MSNRFLKLLLFSSFVLALLIFPNFILAADPPPCECTFGACCDGCYFKSSSSICYSWPDYGCAWGTACGSDVGVNTFTQFCSGSGAECEGNITESGWTVAYPCSEWQVCAGISCACSSSCLEMPTGPYPADNDENVKLPVTLMWNAVPGAQSYRYKIEGITEGVTTTPYITIKNCTLNSSSTYNWQVQPCCDAAGGSCGEWSNLWTFKTSLAPELLFPADGTEEMPLPVTLDWCDVEEAQSYYLQRYEKGVYVPPFLIAKEDEILPSIIMEGHPFFTKDTSYQWEVATCLNPNGTKCGFNCEDAQEGSQCGTYSQRWNFTTKGTLSPPELDSPKIVDGNPPTINFSHYLGWKEVTGVRSYRYQIKKDSVEVLSTSTISRAIYFSDIWNYLEFNKEYSWKVSSCWDEIGQDCEDTVSEEWSFKTTGALPAFNEEGSGPANGAVDISIPVKLNWDDAPGAASYYYSIADATGTIKKSEVLIEYPILKQNTNYNWRVQTCADEEGKRCGESIGRNFTTFTLSPPSNPNPENNGEFSTSENYLKWEGTAKYYQYKVDYQGSEKIPLTIVAVKSAFTPAGYLKTGSYAWYVRSCLDKNCQEVSEWAGPWNFTLVQREECKPGLIPCGRDCDVLDTIEWDETDPCEFKHVFLLLNNILNFVLWRLGLIILVILAITTGVIYYFSMGAPTTMARVKSILKSAGIGYGIIFLAWLIINWVLVILGFQVGVFGHWWQINF